MNTELGILFSLGALVCWTFGDFFIQRTIRAVGIWQALFWITGVGAIGLFPFVYRDIDIAWQEAWVLILVLSIVTLVAALFDFAALKEGKISIIEPVLGLELPITVGLGIIFAGDRITPGQGILIGVIFFGIVLAVTRHLHHLKSSRSYLEKGVVLAGVGAATMALTNFLTGVTSRELSPLLTIWFMHTFLGIISFLVLTYTGQLSGLMRGLRKHPGPIVAETVFDNMAWISFATAMVYIPISIATAISESYIVFVALLGIYVNRERLVRHQLLGAAIAVSGIIVLALIT